jgi:hypothetical protein
MTLRLGRKQRRMLADMARFGQGRYPQAWRMNTDDRRVMTSLYGYGLVTSEGAMSMLTEAGWKQVAGIRE